MQLWQYYGCLEFMAVQHVKTYLTALHFTCKKIPKKLEGQMQYLSKVSKVGQLWQDYGCLEFMAAVGQSNMLKLNCAALHLLYPKENRLTRTVFLHYGGSSQIDGF